MKPVPFSCDTVAVSTVTRAGDVTAGTYMALVRVRKEVDVMSAMLLPNQPLLFGADD